MSSMATSKLTLLVPTTPYILVYTLPLLLLSVLLIFAGTFLTLDRSRSFPSHGVVDYSVLSGTFELKPKKHRFSWLLEGGVGGLASGYAFGLHLSTFLALLIPATTSSAALSSKSFLAVWILSCIPTTALAGRYRYVALGFSGIAGGVTTSLSFSVILHPSLLPRLVLLGVVTCLLTGLVAVSSIIPRLSGILLRPVLRVCTSSIGAFGLVISISLLITPQVDAWANVWERLWLKNGEGWGTSKERGLSAAWAVFWIIGMASDWALNRWVGECPDEKWDDYLSKYGDDLPNQPGRAGTFQPLASFWDKLLSPSQKNSDLFNPKASKDIIFPSEKDMKGPPYTQASPLQLKRHTSLAELEDGIPSSAAFLKKSRSQKIRDAKLPAKSKKPIKFGAIDELSSDSDSDLEGDKEKKSPLYSQPTNSRPRVIANQPSSYSSSTPTLVEGRTGGNKVNPATALDIQNLDYDKEIANLRKIRGAKVDSDAVNYSDPEDNGDGDLGQQKSPPSENAQEGWSPGFLKRHRAQGVISPPIAGVLPVPATPSLIRAIDRINAAHREALSPLSRTTRQNGVRAHDGMPVAGDLHLEDGDDTAYVAGGREEQIELDQRGQQRAPRWEEFWREVRVKAQS